MKQIEQITADYIGGTEVMDFADATAFYKNDRVSLCFRAFPSSTDNASL